MLLSIIVPAYNEERTIAKMIRELCALSIPKYQKEIIVVNDGSSDGTRSAVSPFSKEIIYREREKNAGKGAAVRTGVALATGDFIAIQDADLEYSPEEIPRLVQALKEHPEWRAVYGSRNLAPTGRGYGTYILGVWFLTKLVNILFGSSLTDVYTCHKLIRASTLRGVTLRSNGFEIEMEITARLLQKGGKIGEIPIAYRPRNRAEGKKIRPIDGLHGLLALFTVYFSRF